MRFGRLVIGTLVAFAVAGAVVAGASVAVAQPRKHGTKPPTRPTAPEASTPDESAASGGMAKEEADAAPVAAPMMASGGDDGGIRPSPLNPAPNEMPGYATVDAGTVDYDRLLGDIAALRARVAAVGENLFHSRVALFIETDGSHAKIGKLTVAIDDGVIYSAPGGAFHADDMTPIYEHSVAPGRHAITIDVARRDDRSDAFRNEQKSRFTVDVPRDEELTVEIEVDDYSGMGDDFPSDKKGKYDFRVKVKAVSKALKK